jgi:prolyl oligopeptidase
VRGRRLGWGALAALCLSLAGSVVSAEPADPHRWLEDVTGERALSWVRTHNEKSKRKLARSAQFEQLEARLLSILDSKDKIPSVQKLGPYYYNFWKDEQHVRGLWRRTTLAEYKKAQPAWETVLDLDALSAEEKTPWVWHGADALPPDYTRCLLSLSRGGADADVVREFDLVSKAFVPGGFALPEAKSNAGWRGRDELFVGTDFGPGSLTSSGYPRVVKTWKRGTPLAQAQTLYEGKPDDVWIGAYRDPTPGFERDFVSRAMTFYTNELFFVRGGALVKIDKPDDAQAEAVREWLLFELRSEWKLGAQSYPAGALVAARFDDWLAGKRELQLLFKPSARLSLSSYTATKNAVLLNELDNVRSRLCVLTFEGGRWVRRTVPGLPKLGAFSASAVDRLESDDYWLEITDFTTPTSLHLGRVGGGTPEQLKQLPAFFDATGIEATQHEAVSKDGTRVPYFLVGKKDVPRDGTARTLLYGYGGFETSLQPGYSGLRGAGWLERGGMLAIANIRGGGEFGPSWHQAALKEKRPRAYEDFIAVAEDLIDKKVTSPAHLGCNGGSNGGLLVGNMLTLRPELFGAVVAQVPLLDMSRYHVLLAGASWMGEYGDPSKPEEWAFIQGFSPYHNLRKGVRYPKTLFTTSTRDDRVHPGHARKMVARLSALGQDVLYYENVEGGHGGASTNAQTAFMWALAYEFLWRALR